MSQKRKKAKKKGLFDISLSTLGVVIIALVMTTYGVIAYEKTTLRYDSSMDGSEIAEELQQIVPSDVLIGVAAESNINVLGARSDTLSLPIPKSIKVPILMYHYVEYVRDKNDTKRISLNTTPYILEEEIKTLIEAGYTFMTHKELSDVMNGKSKLPSKPVLLTFDDSYKDFYTDAYPLLKKYNVKATQYTISGFLNRPNHMSSSELQEIAKDGLVEIASHTVNHVWLKGGALQTITAEVTQSKKDLEQLIKKSIVSFAYPYGAFDEQARQAVKNAGYESAVSTIQGTEQTQENKFFLSRLRPGGRTGQALIDWISNAVK